MLRRVVGFRDPTLLFVAGVPVDPGFLHDLLYKQNYKTNNYYNSSRLSPIFYMFPLYKKLDLILEDF